MILRSWGHSSGSPGILKRFLRLFVKKQPSKPSLKDWATKALEANPPRHLTNPNHTIKVPLVEDFKHIRLPSLNNTISGNDPSAEQASNSEHVCSSDSKGNAFNKVFSSYYKLFPLWEAITNYFTFLAIQKITRATFYQEPASSDNFPLTHLTFPIYFRSTLLTSDETRTAIQVGLETYRIFNQAINVVNPPTVPITTALSEPAIVALTIERNTGLNLSPNTFTPTTLTLALDFLVTNKILTYDDLETYTIFLRNSTPRDWSSSNWSEWFETLEGNPQRWKAPAGVCRGKINHLDSLVDGDEDPTNVSAEDQDLAEEAGLIEELTDPDFLVEAQPEPETEAQVNIKPTSVKPLHRPESVSSHQSFRKLSNK